MGKKEKNKKKGKGAEKTIAKTEKKQANKHKKELAAIGEDDIENIIAEIEKEDQRRQHVKIIKIDAPTKRINFSFISHPDKEELILFGGEFFNGKKNFLYNDLFLYNINNNTWSLIKSPGGPPPRCGHQMISTSTNKGQLWLFGGEFCSQTQSQFYHYRDLWIFHLENHRWEKLTAVNGPSSRSGHRMVYSKKHIIVFGGFHDNLRDYKYFNDVYIFNTETFKWTKLEPTGTAPSPRSGVLMTALPDGKILLFGGYTKIKLKKDVDKGQIHSDAYLLVPDKNDTTFTKWKWVQTKLSGIHFSDRSGMSVAIAPNNTAYIFGGVFDEEEEESITGKFFNDLFVLDLGTLSLKTVTLSGKKDKSISKPRRRKNKTDENTAETENIDDKETVVNDEENFLKTETKISNDGIFTVTVGPENVTSQVNTLSLKTEKPEIFCPVPRMNCGLVIKHGILYLYGGMFETDDKQLTLNDFYSLDLKKLEEWKTIIENDVQEWLDSDSETEDENSEDDVDSDPCSDSEENV